MLPKNLKVSLGISCSFPVSHLQEPFGKKPLFCMQNIIDPLKNQPPLRISRYYYDLSRLSKAGFAEKAMEDLELLQDVITNKTLLFPSAWANYGLILNDCLKLLHLTEHLKDLERDYAQTSEIMLFGEKPSFKELLEDMAILEKKMQRKTQMSCKIYKNI